MDFATKDPRFKATFSIQGDKRVIRLVYPASLHRWVNRLLAPIIPLPEGDEPLCSERPPLQEVLTSA